MERIFLQFRVVQIFVRLPLEDKELRSAEILGQAVFYILHFSYF